jgi:predicted permease
VWRRLVGRRKLDAEIREELRFHFEQDVQEGLAAGLTEEEARRVARLKLGNAAVLEEDTRASWGWSWLERAGQDLRFSGRLLRRRPAFALTAIVTLALGIGGATALFSLANALLLRRLPVERSDELVRLTEMRGGVPLDEFTVATYDRLRPSSRALSGVIVSSSLGGPGDIEVDGQRRDAIVQLVSDNYFEVLGVRPIGGRLFHPPGPGLSDAAIAVISADYWRAAYASSPGAIGAHFRRGTREFTIVGIAPGGFRGTAIDVPVDIWVLLDQLVPPNSSDRLRGRWMHIMGRLAPGATPTQAGAEAAAILGRGVEYDPGATGYSELRRNLSRPLLLVGLVVVFVLLIACANLANLMLAGTAARERELGIRAAIGASRARIARQLLTEGVLLAAIGGVLALGVAYWISGALLALLPPAEALAIPNLQFDPDLRVLAFAAFLTGGTSVLFSLVPALWGASQSVSGDLKTRTGGTQSGRRWFSLALTVSQVVMCTVLLVVAGVFVRTLGNLRGQEAGYREDHLLVADVRPTGSDEDLRDRLIENLRTQIAALPGVETAAFSHVGLLEGAIEFEIGFPGESGPLQDRPTVIEQRVSPGFMHAMGTAIVTGRDFAPSDDARAPEVAIVNESFVRRFLPERNPIGVRFFRYTRAQAGEAMEVVGVVRDSKWIGLRNDPPPMYYRPYRQMGGTPVVRFAIRTTVDPRTVARALPEVARSVDANIVLTNVVPFSEIVDRTLVIERLVAHVSSAFGGLALLIAAVGLYGVLAYGVARRRREVGLRLAVGALPRVIEWMFLKESLRAVLLGMAIGLPIALGVTRLASSMLFGLSPQDPTSIGTALAVLTGATAVAAYLPARRAGAVDPAITLRED